jgi:hypothetical protein
VSGNADEFSRMTDEELRAFIEQPLEPLKHSCCRPPHVRIWTRCLDEIETESGNGVRKNMDARLERAERG